MPTSGKFKTSNYRLQIRWLFPRLCIIGIKVFAVFAGMCTCVCVPLCVCVCTHKSHLCVCVFAHIKARDHPCVFFLRSLPFCLRQSLTTLEHAEKASLADSWTPETCAFSTWRLQRHATMLGIFTWILWHWDHVLMQARQVLYHLRVPADQAVKTFTSSSFGN